MLLTAPAKSLLSAPFGMCVIAKKRIPHTHALLGVSCFARAAATRALHHSVAPKREAAPSRQVTQVGGNQLSLETPRNTVGMYAGCFGTSPSR